MVSIIFAKPVFLWLLLLVPLVFVTHFLFLKRAYGKAMRFANFQTLKRIDGNKFLVKNYAVMILRILVITVLVLSLAEMTYYYQGVRNDVDFVIAIDTSPSMVSADTTPTRFDAAIAHANSLIAAADGFTNFGVISFSGVTYVHQSLSPAKMDARVTLSLLNISRISGTDISGAIVAGTNLLSVSERGKAIVLFTDGVDTAGAYLDDSVQQAVAYALENDVVLHTVGYGTSGAPVGYLPTIYNLSSAVDRETLTYMSNVTGGSAFFPRTNQEADAYFSALASAASPAQIPFSLKKWGILLALLLLAVEWLLLNFRFRRIV